MHRVPFLALAAAAVAVPAEAACREETAGAARYAVCEFNPATDDIRLFLNGADGAPFAEFARVEDALRAQGKTLLFAMNAGMYHRDRTPVGLYVEDGTQLKKVSTADGPGNFHLKPNGVFWISEAKEEGSPRLAIVETTDSFLAAAHNIRYATQSGPMLVINGALHPKFLPHSTSFKRRNGVGVREDGTVVFAISDTAVTFHQFAAYFRDVLNCPNALYLDGAISRLYAPSLERDEQGLPMGPIVAVVATAR
ncbi:MAG: phosphodiester glycosidase family protein [Parvularculaceae bacterium]